jgi:prepilin-type N-terminal cleavage/methylation domain-containing protein
MRPLLPVTRRLALAIRERRSAGRRERGVTLVELLVSTAILAVVLPLAGALLTGALTSQRDVSALAAAANDAQTVVTSVEAGGHNASAIKRTSYTPTSGTQPNEMLVVRTQVGRSGSPIWYCHAWYYDAVAQVLYSKRVPASGSSAITAPTDGVLTTWTELARGVTPVAPASPPTPLITVTATRVELDFLVSAGTRKPVVMSTAISKRPQGQTGSAPCF